MLSGWREKAYNGQTCTFLLRPSVKPISIYKNCSFRRALCHSLQTNRGYRLKKNESDFLFLEIFSSVCFCATLSFVHQTLTYRYIIFCLYFSLFTQKNIVRVVCINIIAIIIFFYLWINKWKQMKLTCASLSCSIINIWIILQTSKHWIIYIKLCTLWLAVKTKLR